MRNESLVSSSHHRRYGSQPISVPFLWEQKPGMPKRDWIAKPISFVTAKISQVKPTPQREIAIIPLKLVISVPFQWEEKPGKPLVMDEKPCSTILPAAVSAWNPFINEAENVFDGLAFSMHHGSISSDQKFSSFHGSSNEELVVKSSHLVKRKLTLGELILLSRRLSCPKHAVYVRKQRLFTMELIRGGLFACFSFGTNVQKK